VLCLSALHKDPKRRYRIGSTLLMRDVDHFQNAKPLEARPIPGNTVSFKFVRRNRGAMAPRASHLESRMVSFFTVRLAKARDTALAEPAAPNASSAYGESFSGRRRCSWSLDSLRVITIVDRACRGESPQNSDPKVQAEL